MTNEDGTIWITYNGEIYNHLPLREELRPAGHRFRTDHADTEVIVHAYEQWGAKCLERFEGMFAIAIWDGPRRRLFLARDRIGVKPLYVAFRPGLVLFASEIKALLAHPAVTAAVSPAAMYHYLSFLTTPAAQEDFCVQDTRSLLARACRQEADDVRRSLRRLPERWRRFEHERGAIADWVCMPLYFVSRLARDTGDHSLGIWTLYNLTARFDRWVAGDAR